MIAIIEYGLGNVRAFANVYERLKIPAFTVRDAAGLRAATKIILPGVGAFDHAISRLNNSGMRETLDKLVLESRLPVIGICVGMQILAKSSEEGVLPGLGWIDGVVKKFDPATIKSKTQLPHMGWNTIRPKTGNPLLAGLNADSRFYFLHSYYFQCHNPDNAVAGTEYGARFASVVNSGNIYGVQFHPEKSHQAGIRLLKNFADL
jgi:glutamine amidotransferase